jgi:uncharacterized protein YceH (UPF0502 family)
MSGAGLLHQRCRPIDRRHCNSTIRPIGTTIMEEAAIQPKWQPIRPIHRRVLGVLIEKAKTTPAAYPLSLNAIVTGSNQKSARDPMMSLTEDQVEQALEELRGLGAVGEVQGGSRVPKYRHYAKDWLGVEGDEVAVMGELLLRGTQTLGELRGRAARMAATITDIGALKPTVQSLIEKGLVLALTPEGRGQVVTHALFTEREMEAIRAEHSSQGGGRAAAPSEPAPAAAAPHSDSPALAAAPPSAPAAAAGSSGQADLAALLGEVRELRERLARVEGEVQDIWDSLK